MYQVIAMSMQYSMRRSIGAYQTNPVAPVRANSQCCLFIRQGGSGIRCLHGGGAGACIECEGAAYLLSISLIHC